MIIEQFSKARPNGAKENWYLLDTEFGQCQMRKADYDRGLKPNIKSAVNKLEYFKNECNKIHNNKYDYSLVNYDHIHDVIQIICPEHGIFEQKAYSHKQGIGCKLCSTNNDNEEIKQKLIENGFEIVSFKSTEIIVKDKYGTYKTMSSRVRENIYPTVKTCLNRNEYFINKAKEIHGDKYDYSLVDYKSSNKKIKIICPVHGEFEKLYGTHVLKEEGCPYCMEETNYFFKSKVSNNTQDVNLYVLKCFNETENFYKIGITSKTDIKLRFNNLRNLPYNYEVLYFNQFKLDLTCYLEKFLHKKYKEFKYKPLKSFHGQYECFTSVDNYLNLIQEGKNLYESSINDR